ncbi:recombinase family protein [Gordonia humi]|uniref:recombinase family protein n=1 Tax=Gordonia humi TaxID=686429 RepID=UPI003606FB52
MHADLCRRRPGGAGLHPPPYQHIIRNHRALIVVRLSQVTKATTSPERQLEPCRTLCEQRGYEVVGVAEDLDASAGKASPFHRPQIGPLAGRSHTVRRDRVLPDGPSGSSSAGPRDVTRWAQQRNVAIVSATESFLDLTAPFGDIIALLLAKVAEMELEAISDRNASAFRHNFRAGKWRSVTPRATAYRDRKRWWSVTTVRPSSAMNRSCRARCSIGSASNCRAGRTGRNPRNGVLACYFGHLLRVCGSPAYRLKGGPGRKPR